MPAIASRRADRDREAWQEVDLRTLFAPLAKWVAEVNDAARLAEYVSRACHVATSGDMALDSELLKP